MALPRLAAFHHDQTVPESFISLRLITGAENYLDFIDVNTEVVIYDADDGQYCTILIIKITSTHTEQEITGQSGSKNDVFREVVIFIFALPIFVKI